ncbi:adhesion G protein-coupled receptor L3-like isoform X2 [Patiria miniata]|uniref:Adhesion G-protein coupled receptor D1-like n=1 Tax=Patiria miniata TaxID=46514 RepID=A0A913ZEB7_PATMI|nr:adhesion G protein-coupled receptor L3-like isoform X2 [Patiria miniata]
MKIVQAGASVWRAGMKGFGRGSSPAPQARGSGCSPAQALRVVLPVLACLGFASSSSDLQSNNLPAEQITTLQTDVTGGYYVNTTSTTQTETGAHPRTCLDLMNTTGLSQDGFFDIDPDGPGGFPSFLVYCKLESRHTSPGTTVIRTSNPIEGYVHDNDHRVTVTYNSVPDIGAIRALIEVSAGCRQFLSYTCDGLPIWTHDIQHVAWLDWNEMEMLNWGGGQTGVPGCDCHLHDDCFGGGICNCNSPEIHGTDSGYITDTDTLPVTGLVFKNTSINSGSYSVDNLECFGKKSTEAGSSVAPSKTEEATTERDKTTTGDETSTIQPSTEASGTTDVDETSTVGPETTVEGLTAGVSTDAQTTPEPSSTTDEDPSTTSESTEAGSSVAPATSKEATTERDKTTTGDATSTIRTSTEAPGTTDLVETSTAGPETTVEGLTAGTSTDAQTTPERSSTTEDPSTTSESPSTIVYVTNEEAITESDKTTAGDETTPRRTSTEDPMATAPRSTADGLIMTSGTTLNVNTVQPEQETTKANLVNEIGDSLQKQLKALAISAGNTSTDTLINATKNILGKTSAFLSVQDSVDVSTKMSVVSLVESSLSQVALGLRDGEKLQLSLDDTKVEVTSFSSAESLQGYVFSAAGSDSPKVDGQESKDTAPGEEEVTLAISTGSFGHVEGPVKVLVVYQGLANGTEEGTAGVEASTGSGSDVVSKVNSGILSCSVLSGGQSLDVGLEFSLQQKMDTVVGFEDKIVTRHCSFWNTTLKKWSTKGCRTVDAGNAAAATKTNCFCGHNTSFAVLLRVTERPIETTQNSGNEHALEVLSIVLGTLSVICLALTLILYAYLRLFKFLQVKVHANLTAALLVAQLLFLTGINATENLVVCRIITVLLQLFFSAAFSWMLIEGGLLFQRATMVSRQPPKMLYLMLVGWGGPFLLTLISFSVGYHQYGIHGLCWLSAHRGQIWAFLTLVIVVILVNVIVMIVVMKTFLSLKMNKDKDNADRIRASFRAVVVLVPILGLSWIFGLLAETSLVFKYLFVILNSSQGIFVFICHGVLNIEVQKAMKRRRANKVSSLGTSSSEHTQSQSGSKKTIMTTASSEGGKQEDRM